MHRLLKPTARNKNINQQLNRIYFPGGHLNSKIRRSQCTETEKAKSEWIPCKWEFSSSRKILDFTKKNSPDKIISLILFKLILVYSFCFWCEQQFFGSHCYSLNYPIYLVIRSNYALLLQNHGTIEKCTIDVCHWGEAGVINISSGIDLPKTNREKQKNMLIKLNWIFGEFYKLI